MIPLRFISLFCLIFASCSFSSLNIELRKAERFETNQNFEESIKHYKRVVRRDPRSDKAIYSAKKIANISIVHLEDYDSAIFALESLIANSTSIEDKRRALEQLGKLYYEKMNSYERSIIEFQRFLVINEDIKKEAEIRLLIARSYFHMNRMFQAEAELKEIFIFENKIEEDEFFKDLIFKAKMLLASIYHSDKRFQEAVEIYRNLLDDYSDLAMKDKVWLNLSVVLEDTKKYNEAISLLESIKEQGRDQIFIENRIERLREQISQQPGSRGMIR